MLTSTAVIGLAERYGTPLYVFDEATIRARCAELKASLPYSACRILYACKALTLQAVLRVVREEGLWIDAASPNEVRRALRAGFAAAEVHYTGEGAAEDEFRFLARRGVPVSCSSIDQIRLLGAMTRTTPVRGCALRINPGEGDGENHKTNTGGPASKHGIYFDQIAEAREAAAASGLSILGVHSHVGSGTDLARWLAIKDRTLDIARDFPELEFVNLGGGLPVVYDPSTDTPMPLADWGAALSRSMERFSRDVGREIALHIEPGRYVVAECGWLIAEVQTVKRTPAYRFVIVNSGFDHNIRPAFYGSYHPIRFVPADGRPPGAVAPYVVAGHLCESGDVFTVREDGTLAPRDFPEIAVGDLMVMSHVGAYAHPMKSAYNSIDPPASVMIARDGSVRLIERRGTLDDIMRRELEADAAS